MIFLKFDAMGKKTYQHNYPFHEKYGLKKNKEQLEQEGIFIDNIPKSQELEGKESFLCINVGTKELYYKYEDIPSTLEIENIEMQQLENQLLEVQQYIINKEAEELLNMGGM